MREFIEKNYCLEILRWDEPDGEGGAVFEAFQAGHLIRADSLALLISQAQAWLPPAPLLPRSRVPRPEFYIVRDGALLELAA